MLAPTLMIQGTASSVGKSLLVTALCRLFRQDGIDVAPFKAQNMALNSAVTPDGFEIGRAQAVQAEAAGLRPCVEMNPILLKPEGHQRSQVVVLGRSTGSFSAAEYHEHKRDLSAIVADCLSTLRRRHELVIIEGAGSPAEINLKDRDIVNMHVARLAEAPVLLAGDIDRGGVFAAFVGTLALLSFEERRRIVGFVINKFRGDRALLQPGLDFLQRRTRKPVLGVVPFMEDLRIADEDSLSLDARAERRSERAELEIAVVRLPHISNFDDFLPLEHEHGVRLRFIREPADLDGVDLVILPGSKTTVSDLAWLRATGVAAAVERRAHEGGLVLGVCGGCQMLGQWIEDPERVESAEPQVKGLGLLDISTLFHSKKTTAEVRARALSSCFLTEHVQLSDIAAYEIHMGNVTAGSQALPLFQLLERNGEAVHVTDGAVNRQGNVVGTLLHGLFDNEALRTGLLAKLRQLHGKPERAAAPSPAGTARDYDRLATTVREALDEELLYRLARLTPRRRAASAARSP